MATYVIETYLSRTSTGELEATTSRLRAAIVAASTGERPVKYVRSFFVPGDEICFHVVEGPSVASIVELSRAAGLSPERIVEAEAAAG